jgi:hypothetical protein
MSSIFLEPAELATLTGFKAQHRQVAWLQGKGWRFVMNAAGRPIVARKYAEKMLGCGGDDGTASALVPNFGAILRAV